MEGAPRTNTGPEICRSIQKGIFPSSTAIGAECDAACLVPVVNALSYEGVAMPLEIVDDATLGCAAEAPRSAGEVWVSGPAA